MKDCESTLHTFASYVGSPNILDFAFTRDIEDVSEARVHSEILATDHSPISIKVNGVRIISWNIEGLCNQSIRESEVKQSLKDLLGKFSEDPVIFLIQELFLQHEIKRNNTSNAQERMNRLLSGYTFLSDGYTGCIAIPKNISFGNIQYIKRPGKTNKKCIVVRVAYKGIQFNIANIHLKSIVVFPMTGKQLQRKEMKNIIAKTQGPTLFMGDFNTTTPEHLME
jgi:endonuclease/exonuclease/phosphatase family metal-dependent hydrolase